MEKFKIPADRAFRGAFAIVNTISGTYVCPGWHPVPAGTTREQIEIDMSVIATKIESSVEATEIAIEKSYEVVVSGSKQGKEYTVKLERGRWSCTCPASNFRRGDCKHIKAEQINLKSNKN